jgi:formate/nitrite transporter
VWKLLNLPIKTPLEIELEIESIGQKKSELNFAVMFVLALLAGVYVGFGGALATLVSHDLAPYVGVGFAKIIAGAVFSIGLILVILGGAELFTGNNLLVMPLFSGKVKFKRVARNWGLVYLGNLAGSLLLVGLIYVSGYWKVNGSLVGAAALETAVYKVNLSFLESFIKGILANWLVCLAVWLSLAARDLIGKVIGIAFPIAAFVAMGFEHSVANMYFIPLGLLLMGEGSVLAAAGAIDLSNLTWGSFFVNNLLPVTLGNIVGGVFFVGFLYWFAYRRYCERCDMEVDEETGEVTSSCDDGVEID